ncbi:uncharacterized protein PV07_02608 [Cladophialophora immunda]|uniref:Uncharacterized protein n=1 Tax=Cladophialophora immunda TaxID=569365 RepID=A0A0D1ZS85_9EURO|nr:uncharacterized protein PV07_02608 [Cladophialophora immunda]KIW30916.1 hypothetical protein PV07_02608 [Cladophialophora immunda]
MQSPTPPPSLDHLTLPNIDNPLYNVDPDSEPAVEYWLQQRCPKLNVKQLISRHNRVQIPIEEDFKLLWRLRSKVQEESAEDAEKVVLQALKDLDSERQKSEEEFRCWEDKLFSDHPFPPGKRGTWEALLRSRNLLSINGSISSLFPHLFDRLQPKTFEAGTFRMNSPTAAVTKRFRAAKSQKTEVRQRTSTKKRQLRDSTDSRRRNASTTTTPLRRSPRLTKSGT